LSGEGCGYPESPVLERIEEERKSGAIWLRSWLASRLEAGTLGLADDRSLPLRGINGSF
jgi:hypothetical protein